MAVDRDHHRTVAVAKTRLAQRVANRRGEAREHQLGQVALAADGIELEPLVGGRAQARDAPQFAHRVGAADEDQPVACAQHGVGADRGQQVACARELDQEAALEVPKAGCGDRFAGQAAALGDQHFHRVLPGVLGRLVEGRTANRQQPAAGHGQVKQAGQQHRESDRERVEHGHRRQTVRHHQAGHDQVGAGAQQGAHAAQDGGVVHRQQQLGRRHAAGPAPGFHGGGQRGHDRGVVHEGAEHAGQARQPQPGPQLAARWAEHAAADPVDGAGAAQRRHQHEQHRHGQHAGVPEARQGLDRGKHAGQHQQARGPGQHLVRAQPAPPQQAQRGQDHADRQPRLPSQARHHTVRRPRARPRHQRPR